MKKSLLLLGILIVVVLGTYAATKVNASPNPTEPTTTPEVFNPLPADQKAFEAVRAALAQELGVDPLTISLVSVEAVEWTDSCLGLGGPAESCLQAITPGFRVTVQHDATTYEFHTDQTAESIREVK
jgi:hypothetical protein